LPDAYSVIDHAPRSFSNPFRTPEEYWRIKLQYAISSRATPN
jgi:hypothetical protein